MKKFPVFEKKEKNQANNGLEKLDLVLHTGVFQQKIWSVWICYRVPLTGLWLTISLTSQVYIQSMENQTNYTSIHEN